MSSEIAVENARREHMLLSGKEVLVRRIRGQEAGNQAVALDLAIPVPARIDPNRELCFQRYKGDGRLLLPVYPIDFLGRHPGMSKVIPLWTFGTPQGPSGPLPPEDGPAYTLVPAALRAAYAVMPGVPKVLGAADGPARIIARLQVRAERGAYRREMVELTDKVLASRLSDLNDIVAGRVELADHVMPPEARAWDVSTLNRAEVTRAVKAAFGIAKGRITHEMLDELRRGPRRGTGDVIVARLHLPDGSHVEQDVAMVLLRLGLLEIQSLRDRHGSTDFLARFFVRRLGGRTQDVTVVGAVARFFGVGSLAEVTEEQLKATRARLGIHPMQRSSVEEILADMTATAAVTARGRSEVCDALRGEKAQEVAAACQKGSRDVLLGLQRTTGWRDAIAGAKGVDRNLQGAVRRAAVHVGQTVGEMVEVRSWLGDVPR